MFRTCHSSVLRCTVHKCPMQTNWQSSARPAVCLLFFFLLCLPLSAGSQNNAPSPNPAIPAELTATDPEIRALLNYGNSSCKSLDADKWMQNIQRALQIADSRGLVGDRAIAGATLASVLVSEGKIEMAFLAFQRALQDSIDAKNEVLEADILISLASEAEMKGNNQQALELVARALRLTERSASLYEKARALGEFGRLKLLVGKTDEAVDPINEALNIDKLNGYKFEALHLVYKSYYLSLTGHEEQAMESLAQARSKAILTSNAYAFVMAENAYTLGLVRRGKTEEAIGELELVKKGDLQTFAHESKERDCLTFALGLPIMRLLLLEGISNVLRAANLKEKEIEIWHEIFSISQNLGLLAGEAEAEQKIAYLENQLTKTDDALKDYSAAADLYRKLQNESLLAQVQVSQALLLIKVGRGKEALLLEHEVASYAERHGLRADEFIAYGVLAEIYQPAGDFGGARDELEKALSLVRPGPFDDELDNRSVLEDYLFLADDYKALKIPDKELIAIENACFVAVHLKDEKVQQNLVAYLDKRLKELQVRAVVNQSQNEGQLVDSLVYSYILFIRDGFPSKPTDDQSNWQRILNLPFQITRQTGGAASLEEILHEIGPIVESNKLSILTALARYYISDGADPILAEKYAVESEDLIKNAKGDMTFVHAEVACILAISYSRQGKLGIAKDRIAECTSLAKKTGDAQSINYSDIANVIVQTQLGNIAAARSSLENLTAKAPDDPKLHLQLAMSLAGAKLYDEASAQLDFATQRFISSGNKETAAIAYTSVASVLNSDPSEKAQELQLQYLKSARQLYQALDARAEEAETLVALGDYYLKLVQIKTAIDDYAAAFGLAQSAGRPEIVAESQLGLGNAYEAQRDFNRAAEHHRSAADAYHNLPNASREVLSLGDLASDYLELGDVNRAFSTLLEAKNAAKNGPVFSRYLVAYFLGEFYTSLSGQVKSGQRWSGQNRPTDVARDLDVVLCRSLSLQV